MFKILASEFGTVSIPVNIFGICKRFKGNIWEWLKNDGLMFLKHFIKPFIKRLTINVRKTL